MIIGAAQYQLVQPSQVAGQSRAQFGEQQKSIKLAEDKVTLNGSHDDASPTYDRSGLVRKVPERSLTQIALEHLSAQRIGLSKEKLEELEQQKKEVEANTDLSDKERQKLLADLDLQKEALIKEAIERRQTGDDEEQQSNPSSGNAPE
ncbi:MAG: hypothetical protein ACRCTP_22370 [Aeromonas popoffii]|jgi:hypothetical protein|uniref:hypothetical protein n=1 Tax=Aeromonas popoffii TaxID=70856 RepID=UPI0005A5D381|nr:hypothetical protein [Aeromonas popoffii]